MASDTGCSRLERTRLGTPGRWRAVDEHGCVLDTFLQRHRDTEAAKTLFIRLLGEYNVAEVIHTDQLCSCGAAKREIPSLINVDHQQVIRAARCDNVIGQRASVISRAVLPETVASSYTASRATAGKRPHGRCPAQDNSRDSSGGNALRNSSIYTPGSATSTITFAPAFPPTPDEATKSKRPRRGQRSWQGRSEPQTVPALSLP